MTPNQQDHKVPGLKAKICSAIPGQSLYILSCCSVSIHEVNVMISVCFLLGGKLIKTILMFILDRTNLRSLEYET